MTNDDNPIFSFLFNNGISRKDCLLYHSIQVPVITETNTKPIGNLLFLGLKLEYKNCQDSAICSRNHINSRLHLYFVASITSLSKIRSKLPVDTTI